MTDMEPTTPTTDEEPAAPPPPTEADAPAEADEPRSPEVMGAPEMAVSPVGTIVDTVASPIEMTSRRNPNDVYAFGAMLCALLGFIIPIIPAAAALMLVRATEPDLADEPLSPAAQSVANAARTVAYVSLTIVIVLCAALLLGILGRVLSS